MEKIQKMNLLVKDAFKSLNNFIVFPLAIVGLVFILVFYVVSPIYMLGDVIIRELQSILTNDKEKDSNGVQIVKHLFGFGFVVLINFYKTVLSIVLAISYFITAIAFWISSYGSLKVNPFAFSVWKLSLIKNIHALFKSNQKKHI